MNVTQWRELLANEPHRTRIISMIVGLCFLIILPIPESFEGPELILAFMWGAGLLNAFALGFWIDGRWVCGILFGLLSIIYGIKTHYWLPIILQSLLYLWMSKRFHRTKSLSILICLSLGANIFAKESTTTSKKTTNSSKSKTKDIPLGQMPKRSRKVQRAKLEKVSAPNPYPLDAMASCGYLEKIAWQFRSDGFRSRKLFQDYLKLSSDPKPYFWELFQTMNRRGDVTFIFRRKYDPYTYLSIAARDHTFTSALSRSRTSRALAKEDVGDLLNRPVLIFSRSDGSSVNFLPGSMGKATIMIQFAQADGRDLPPIYIRGNFCDRPATLDEGDLQEKTFGKKKNQGGILDSNPGSTGK